MYTESAEAEALKEEMGQFFYGEWEPYVQGKEKITVQAGSWECERVMVEERDDQTKEPMVMTGELVSHSTGYSTELSSY
jgi:hypothetical protein